MPPANLEALADALPFILRLRGQPLVIKYGGSAMEEENAIERTLRDIALLAAVGLRPVVVHGGGKAITTRMREAGLKPRFVAGLRVTDEASVAIVARTLDEEVNPMLVRRLGEIGAAARGLSGRDCVRATRAAPVKTPEGPADLGFVGDVEDMDVSAVRAALEAGEIPVLSPLGRTADGTTLNVNADTVAGALAAALGSGRLVYLSDVPGLMRDPQDADSLLPSLQISDIDRLTKAGVITGGMMPKIESALLALGRGVERVHFVDGRAPHALLGALLTAHGAGTEIVS